MSMERNDDALVDETLARAGLPVTDEERAFYKMIYPLLKAIKAETRSPDARYAEPATVYAAWPQGLRK